MNKENCALKLVDEINAYIYIFVYLCICTLYGGCIRNSKAYNISVMPRSTHLLFNDTSTLTIN